MASVRILLTLLFIAAVSIDAAPKPFFDAIYDAVVGNGRRTYGYDAYNRNGYNGYNGYGGYNNYDNRRAEEEPQRSGKSWKEICKVHFPDSFGAPGAAGVVCPY